MRDPQHRAVPRVSVRVTRKEGARFTDVATVVSGDDGRFRAEGLPEGVVMLEARAVGYQTRVVDSTTLVAGESRHVELVLESGRRLSGRVVDEAGEPVAGAEVTAVPPAEDDSGDQVQPSAADGRFAFEELGRGPFCLYARKPPFVDGEQCSVPVGAEVVLRLVRGGAIAGRVVRSVGAVPIAKFSIAAMRGGADFELTSVQKSFTSPSGEFRLAELSAGVYTVTVRAENRLFAERAGVEVRPGETTGGLVFELGSTGRITGVVTAVGGKPIEGAKVELLLGGRMGGGQKTLTDAAGRFELERVSAGRHRLNVERTGFHPILLRSLGAAAVGGEPVQLQLRPRP